MKSRESRLYLLAIAVGVLVAVPLIYAAWPAAPRPPLPTVAGCVGINETLPSFEPMTARPNGTIALTLLDPTNASVARGLGNDSTVAIAVMDVSDPVQQLDGSLAGAVAALRANGTVSLGYIPPGPDPLEYVRLYANSGLAGIYLSPALPATISCGAPIDLTSLVHAAHGYVAWGGAEGLAPGAPPPNVDLAVRIFYQAGWNADAISALAPYRNSTAIVVENANPAEALFSYDGLHAGGFRYGLVSSVTDGMLDVPAPGSDGLFRALYEQRAALPFDWLGPANDAAFSQNAVDGNGTLFTASSGTGVTASLTAQNDTFGVAPWAPVNATLPVDAGGYPCDQVEYTNGTVATSGVFVNGFPGSYGAAIPLTLWSWEVNASTGLGAPISEFNVTVPGWAASDDSALGALVGCHAGAVYIVQGVFNITGDSAEVRAVALDARTGAELNATVLGFSVNGTVVGGSWGFTYVGPYMDLTFGPAVRNSTTSSNPTETVFLDAGGRPVAHLWGAPEVRLEEGDLFYLEGSNGSTLVREIDPQNGTPFTAADLGVVPVGLDGSVTAADGLFIVENSSGEYFAYRPSGQLAWTRDLALGPSAAAIVPLLLPGGDLLIGSEVQSATFPGPPLSQLYELVNGSSGRSIVRYVWAWSPVGSDPLAGQYTTSGLFGNDLDFMLEAGGPTYFSGVDRLLDG